MRFPIKPILFLLAAFPLHGETEPDLILRGGSATAAKGSCDLQVVSWNIERGERLSELAASLKKLAPALALLQEVDLYTRRTGEGNVAEKLADRLGVNYVFAAEFEELGQGAGGKSAYHGQAMLTALPVSSVRVLQFRDQTTFWQPRWYLPNWPVLKRRTGGRIALVAEVANGPNRLVVYNTHLESRGGEDRRLNQIREVIEDARRYRWETPVLLAGDLNTRDLDSPVVTALLRAGFRKAAGREITTKRGKGLDWVFVRGPLSIANAAVHREMRASDHFPLSVRIRHLTQNCR